MSQQAALALLCAARIGHVRTQLPASKCLRNHFQSRFNDGNCWIWQTKMALSAPNGQQIDHARLITRHPNLQRIENFTTEMDFWFGDNERKKEPGFTQSPSQQRLKSFSGQNLGHFGSFGVRFLLDS
jgi:hypothetical protein